jgi:hypothetical protein
MARRNTLDCVFVYKVDMQVAQADALQRISIYNNVVVREKYSLPGTNTV